MEINIAAGNLNFWHSFDATATVGPILGTLLQLILLKSTEFNTRAAAGWRSVTAGAAASTMGLVLPWLLCSSCFQMC